jgi:hypothetical protein
MDFTQKGNSQQSQDRKKKSPKPRVKLIKTKIMKDIIYLRQVNNIKIIEDTADCSFRVKAPNGKYLEKWDYYHKDESERGKLRTDKLYQAVKFCKETFDFTNRKKPASYKHTVTYGEHIFEIYNDKGSIVQDERKILRNGYMSYSLVEYPNTKRGNGEAGAYLSGFLRAFKFIEEANMQK